MFFKRCFKLAWHFHATTLQLAICSSVFAQQVVRYYAVLAYSENFNVLVVIILLQITIAPEESLGRKRLLCFKPFTVIF